jgi:hypothetical protein
MRYGIQLVLLLWSSACFAQGVGSVPGVELQDEAAVQGRVQKLNCVGSTIVCTKSGVTGVLTLSGGGGGYDTIQEEGSSLTQRTTLNFAGSSITCADDAGTKTTCTITGGSGGLDHPAVMSRVSLGF